MSDCCLVVLLYCPPRSSAELCQKLQFNAESCNEVQHVLADCKVKAGKLSPWCCVCVCVCVCFLALSMRVCACSSFNAIIIAKVRGRTHLGHVPEQAVT